MESDPKNLVREVFDKKGSPREKVSSIFAEPMANEESVLVQEFQAHKKGALTPWAIEWGKCSCKFIQLSKSTTNVELAKIAYFHSQVNGKTLTDLKVELNAFIKKNSIKGSAVLTIPLSETQFFCFTLPDMPEAEISQAAYWKVKQLLGNKFQITQLNFDFVTSQVAVNKVKEWKVVAFGVAKDYLTQVLASLEGLKITAVDVEPYAQFCALFWAQQLLAKETVGILHLGASESSLSLVNNFNFVHTQLLNYSGRHLTEAIASSQKIDWQKAELIKKQEGVRLMPVTSGADGNRAVVSQLESLALDVEHAVRVFTGNAKPAVKGLSKLVLVGGGALMKNVERFLSDRLDLPVVIFDSFHVSRLILKEELHPVFRQNPARWSAVLGTSSRFLEW